MRLKRFLLWVLLAVSLTLSLSIMAGDRALAFRHPPQPPAEIAQVPATEQVQAVPVVGMTVADMDTAVRFYTEALTFEKIADIEVLGDAVAALQGVFGVRLRVVRLQLGDEVIELTQYLTHRGRPIPLDSRSNDLWFQHIAIVVSDMDAAYARLRQFNVQHVSTAPQTLPDTIPAAAGIAAFYFQDPDQHVLEIIAYPEDKGDPRWQSDDALFLGIDHTAIGVADTATSLAFYRDLLGLQFAGESLNSGTEQAHLNNVFGARLHISGLTAGQGINVEFLEYLAPANGRPYPADSQPTDLWHWEITMVVADVEAAAARLLQAGVPFISSGVIDLGNGDLGFRQGCLIRDPDGHAIRLVDRLDRAGLPPISSVTRETFSR